MKKYLTSIACFFFANTTSIFAQAKTTNAPKGEYYQLTVYHFKTNVQIAIAETYL